MGKIKYERIKYCFAWSRNSGIGVVKIIEENRQQIIDTLNKDIVIKHILVRDKSKKDL